MAFADVIRNTTHTINDVADLTEKLLSVINNASITSLINTSSPTQVDIASASITLTVLAGESVEIHGSILASHGTANAPVNLYIYRDTTALEVLSPNAPRSSTGGSDLPIPIFYVDTPGAGTFTYKLRWSVASGTAYSAKQKIMTRRIRVS